MPDLKSIETFCMKLSSEVFREKTEHFERIDGHFDVDGLIAKYKCNLDNRIYSIKITASK